MTNIQKYNVVPTLGPEHYLDVLFDSTDHLCIGYTPYDTAIEPISHLDISKLIERRAQFVALNPLKPGSTRRDSNVEIFRNVVIEIDEGSLDSQAELIEARRVPYTTAVYSGGKSLHVVISLEIPMTTREEYDELVADIYACVPEADPTCKNPSRFTRLGGVVREKNNIEQTILDIRDRVTGLDLERFFSRNRPAVEAARRSRAANRDLIKKYEERAVSMAADKGELSVRTKDFLRLGARAGERNRELFIAAADFANQGYSHDEAMGQLIPICGKMGLEPFEITRTIRSAFQKAVYRPRIIK